MLMKHGLPGLYRFRGGSGALEFLRQAGCIQLVPVDVCGKNAELTLQSRVKGLQSRRLTSLCTRQRAISVVVRPFDALFIVLPPDKPLQVLVKPSVQRVVMICCLEKFMIISLL